MNMKHHIGKFAALALAIGLLLPSFAQAYPKQGWYVGLGAGGNFLQDIDAVIAGTTNRIESNPGFVLDSSLGFGFESQLRPEFEIAFRRNNVDKTSGAGAGTSPKGNFNSVAFMGNLLYDVDTHGGLTPYIGAGIGGALIGANSAGPVFGTRFDNQPFEFAYQGIAGLSYELSERWDMTADYRYFATLDPTYKTITGVETSSASYANHTFMLGLRYVFGVEREVPVPVAMHAQPRQVMVVPAQPVMQQPVYVQQQMAPPPPPVVPETYIVFFDFDKSYLTTEAKETIQRAAEAFRRGGVARVQITGHTDTRGSGKYNQRLSERRAKMVQGYMVSLGVPSGEIITRGAGKRELMVPTANNVREAKNRRAEIMFVQ